MNNTPKIVRAILHQDEVTPNDIIYIMYLNGLTIRSVAAALSVSRENVSQTVHGHYRSKTVENYIAENTNTSTSQLFGKLTRKNQPQRPHSSNPRRAGISNLRQQ